MDKESLETLTKVSGEFAWLAMAAFIFTYDMVAIKTKRYETMSSALWRSLSHSFKAPFACGVWLVITHHLFANKNARQSYSKYTFKRMIKEI